MVWVEICQWRVEWKFADDGLSENMLILVWMKICQWGAERKYGVDRPIKDWVKLCRAEWNYAGPNENIKKFLSVLCIAGRPHCARCILRMIKYAECSLKYSIAECKTSQIYITTGLVITWMQTFTWQILWQFWFYLKIIEHIQSAQTYLQENTKEDWRFKLQPQETTESVLWKFLIIIPPEFHQPKHREV